MSILRRKIPPFIYKRSNLTLLVVFTSVFALFFINIYKPFESPQWYPITQFEYFLYSSLIILTGVLVVVISRIIMFYYTKKRTLTYWEYIIWVIGEIFFMSLFYTLYSYTLDEARDFMEVYRSSVINTSLILLLPYIITLLFLSWKENSHRVKLLEKALEQGEANPQLSVGILTFYDEKGELLLSIKKDSLLYLEAADNYVSVWYLSKNGVTKYLIRNTLRQMEERFEHTSVVRCHRSFMVNLDQVKIAKRTRNGIVLDLGTDKVPDIPVSRTYAERIAQWFTKI
ncbi:MAG TPA: LytTR family DNA-binding domain-containing protein [Bacteroidales bacterium]|nr:LytTR family DNA-binding domain-containing protein [Bacteroidales bacterium]